MGLHEIVLPETKPETEWVRGRALQKVSPTWNHSRLQGALFLALSDWAAGRGEIGIEWRFRVTPPGAITRPLVPDLSFVRDERLRLFSDDEIQIPLLSPDVAFEILSPDDRAGDVEDKVGVYLCAGTELVVLVDPRARTVTLVDAQSRRTLREHEVFEHPALPGFSLHLDRLFATLRRPT
jgi:Uma2 family endonuclease